MNNTLQKKVIIGALAHESNDFAPKETMFENFEYYAGEQIFKLLPVKDIFDEANIEVIPSIYAVAPSSGLVDQTAYLQLENEILDCVRAHPDVDGIWMYCHGAMNVAGIGSGEYRLAKDIRQIVNPNCVIAFGMDLHGNIESDLNDYVNIFRCFHTAPHTDQEDTFRHTAKVLVDYLQNGYTGFPQERKLQMIFPGEMASTATEPFRSIIEVMKDVERNDACVACASAFIGFAWTDAERTSSTVVVVPSSPDCEDHCSEVADSLAELLFSKRREFTFETLALPPAETVRCSLHELMPTVCVTDMGDNPTAGTSGGSTVLLREFLLQGTGGKRVLIAGIFDDIAYKVAYDHAVGECFPLKLGIDIDEVSRPVTMNVCLESKFAVLGYSTPSVPPIKRCDGVRVNSGSLDIIITDKPYAFTQTINFTSSSIDPGSYHIVVTKFGYIFPELKIFSNSTIMSNTPGESYQDIKTFKYKNIRRPIFPFDDI